MSQHQNALIIFIKNPSLGKVKTRLAKTVGDEKALDIYRQLLDITRHNASILADPKVADNVKPYVFYSDFINLDDDWPNDIFEKRLQSGEDLGTRMYRAFAEILPQHPNACIIGSDCPTLSAQILGLAFKGLTTNDFAIGPSTDGGYYLLGMKDNPDSTSFHDESYGQYLFDKIEWSTENVLPETLRRIKSRNKTVHQLPFLTDVDEEKDWLSFTKLLE